MASLSIFAPLLWLALLVAALHLRQPRDVRSWWQTASWTVQFLVLLSLAVSAIVPPAPTPWGRAALIVVSLLPLLLLLETLWLVGRDPARRRTS